MWDVVGIILTPMLSWQSGPKPLLNEFGIHHSLKTCDLSKLAFRWVSFINKIVVISATQIEHWDIPTQGRKKREATIKMICAIETHWTVNKHTPPKVHSIGYVTKSEDFPSYKKRTIKSKMTFNVRVIPLQAMDFSSVTT